MTHRFRTGLLIIAAAALGAGCNKDDSTVRTYEAPKDIPAPQVASNDMAPSAPADAGAAAPIQWTLPPGWKQLAGGGEMRYATITVSSADPKAQLTVVPLPAEAAAVLPNVQRWAGQLKLATVTQADLSKYVQQTQVSGEQAQIVDMTGSPETGNPPTRLLAAIVPHEGRAWFFTLKGPQPLAAAQKANFETFIHSIQFASAPPASNDSSGSIAENATPSGPSNADAHAADPAAAGSYKLVKWTTPAGWTEQPGANSMRVTSFRVGPQDQQTEVIVAKIRQGQTGSFVDNINRWRGQVGLDPVARQEPGEMAPVTVAGHQALLFDATGPKAPSGAARQVLVAIDIEGDDFWFVKMLGPQPIVSKQQQAFRQFLGSLKFAPQ